MKKSFILRSLSFFVAILLLVVGIFAASWADNSSMTALQWLPQEVGQWADREPNFRTAFPFVGLAFFLALIFFEWSRPWGAVLAVILSLLVLAAAEVGQLALPGRTADWKDIGWGSVGIASGLLIAVILDGISRLVRRG